MKVKKIKFAGLFGVFVLSAVIIIAGIRCSSNKSTTGSGASGQPISMSGVLEQGTVNVAVSSYDAGISKTGGALVKSSQLSALSAMPLTGYSLYCVTFTSPTVSGSGKADASGNVTFTFNASGIPFGCFILDQNGTGVATVTFSNSSGSNNGQAVSFSGGTANLGTITVDLANGEAQATLTSAGTIVSTPPSGGLSASGTYTWDSTTGSLTLNITSSNFVCNGPTIGTKTQPGVTVSATTMIWQGNNLTWNRSSGTAGNIIGTWTASDNGNSYTLIFNTDGTLSITGNIVSCSGSSGGSGGPAAVAEAQHWSSGYLVQLRYSDPSKAATAVTVTGYGITGSVALTYNNNMSSWGSGTPESQISLGTSAPTGLPFNYIFTITDTTGTWATTSTVPCFQTQFVTNISPTGTVTGTPTFGWTGIGDSNAIYGVQLNDNTGKFVWADYYISGTSIVYSGPALISGMAYGYVVSVQSSSACNNQGVSGGSSSSVAGTFTYQ